MSVVAPDTVTSPSPSLDGLVECLRRHGHDSRPVADIAAEFGVTPEFVSEVVEVLRAERTPPPGPQIFLNALSQALTQVFGFLRRVWMEATDNPMLFVVLTGVVGYWGAVAIEARTRLGSSAVANAGFLLTVTFVLHQLCYARYGMVRYPIYGAGAAILATLVANFGGRYQYGVSAFVMNAVMTGVLYGFLGSVAALLGGAVIVSQRDRKTRALSRQEALDRLFAVKERLAKSGPDFDKVRRTNWLRAAQTDPKWPLVSITAGFALGAVQVLVLGGYQHVFPGSVGEDPIYMTFQVFSGIFTALAFLGIGFLSGGFGRAIASQFLAFGGFWASTFIRLGRFGPDTALAQLRFDALLVWILLLLLSGCLSGIGVLVENASRRERRRAADDPATLVAEIVQLERILKAESSSRFVVSVDVAKSTAMKSAADPLKVEWSFREYQKLVADCTVEHCGQVVATSGDGTVLTFGTASEALEASKDILTRLTWFNARLNRLETPFRVRIGIHSDEVHGVLEDVQFTEVIDIAAHVQASAPVGGILVTECVAACLPDEPLSALKEPVDGKSVLLVVNPTIGP